MSGVHGREIAERHATDKWRPDGGRRARDSATMAREKAAAVWRSPMRRDFGPMAGKMAEAALAGIIQRVAPNRVMKLISEIYEEANRLADRMGRGFLKKLHSDEHVDDDELKKVKEGLELGGFALKYNDGNKPQLMYAVRNPARSGHADYTVFDENRGLLCDLELTSVWERPNTWKEEPCTEDSGATDVYIDDPARFGAYQHLGQTIKKHLRTDYPLYWLVIYDNSSRAFRDLPRDEGARRTQDIIARRSDRLPPNLQQVWVWDSSGFIRRVF